MVTHYTGESGKIACGRNNHYLVSTSEVSGVRCKKCLGSHVYQQGVWFGEFQRHTGTEPMGLEEWAAGTMPFAKAAQHSLTCYRIEVQEMVDRLERQLNPLIL
ncbi:hypothetical protein RBU55_00985 [Pseudomonas chlororaphis subsp. aurantiaca]|uniref:hypothetical protein n=1 Tax=Pseudomonas chlororaphis TaxID=587753 RepID=UPI0027DB3628|nr:hypothetical protein [Pseudomonas chlororaphis]WMJ00159.1 hypothetical protein RBU55_00985 [Pseudomonas chlororaphis subsp. aurantiaca]